MLLLKKAHLGEVSVTVWPKVRAGVSGVCRSGPTWPPLLVHEVGRFVGIVRRPEVPKLDYELERAAGFVPGHRLS